VTGGEGYDQSSGYVKVYRVDDDGGNRMQLGQAICGDATSDYVLSCVDITANGMTIICGIVAPYSSNDYQLGYVRVFSIEGGDDDHKATWKQIGQDIIGCVYSVSISKNGKTFAVAGNLYNRNNRVVCGHVRIFRLEEDCGTRWEQIGNGINGDVFDLFSPNVGGKLVSLSADGTTVAIGYPYFGSPYVDENGGRKWRYGQVRVYQINVQGLSWEQLGEVIYGNKRYDRFGQSVNLSPNGNALAIGSPGGEQGCVRVFSLVEGDADVGTSSWKQIGGDILGEANYDFGQSVSLSDDGNTLAVGAQGHCTSILSGSGYVRVYRRTDADSDWMQLGNDIDSEAAGDYLGHSVSLSADGNMVAVGTPMVNNDYGHGNSHVRVFVLGCVNPVDPPITTCTSSTGKTIAAINTSRSFSPLHLLIPKLTFFQSQPADTPLSWEQKGPKIIGDATGDWLGFSVALSSDGSTLVTGGGGHNQDTGYVKVYRVDDDGGNRMQIGQTIYGDATGDYFGSSVDITANGMTIICGSPGFYGTQKGYVRVFALVGGNDNLDTATWKQIGEDIIVDVEANDDLLGYSVSISEDGKTIAVSVNLKYDTGTAWVHVRIFRLEEVGGTRWEQIGNDINGEVVYGGPWSQGSEYVSLSADGTTVAIGSPYDEEYNDRSGQVRVYRINVQGLSWEQLGQVIYDDNPGNRFGQSVNLSHDGNALAISSPSNENAHVVMPGYVKVFSLVEVDGIAGTGCWQQIGAVINGEVNSNWFGISVSLSDDAKTLAVGGRQYQVNDRILGHVRVYRRMSADPELGWMQLGHDIIGEPVYKGPSVSLSADGNMVAVGSSYYANDVNYGSGHVRVFVLG
jgi:hypothetical protein